LNCSSSYTSLSSSCVPGLSTQYSYCRAVLQIEVLLLRVIFSSNAQYLLLSIPHTCITCPWVVLYSISTLRWAGSHPVTNSSQPPLDAAKEHHLVTTKINDQPAKTLVDQQTAGADLIGSKFCTLHNLLLYPLKNPITLQMTMKGSKGSISHYTKVNCDWLGWSEERIFYVAARKDWDVILGSPALRHAKAVINMGTISVTIQPPGISRITLAPWKTTTSQKTPWKNSSTTSNHPTPAKTNIFHFQATPTHQII